MMINKLGKYFFFIVSSQKFKAVVLFMALLAQMQSTKAKSYHDSKLLNISYAFQTIKAITVTGKVTDDKGETLPGVSVAVKGQGVSAVTDVKGMYKIVVTSADAVLLFTYVGFETKEVLIGTQRTINVVLKEKSSLLEQVVVIGYGDVKKSDLTGSVSEVKMTDLKKAPVATFEQALAGRVAGVQVSSGDGQPGADLNVVIRGGNSLTQQNAPLYVVDGFPLESSVGSIISPSDIESISILKDASATAIYGARGANGVVIIETKKGKVGKPDLQYEASYGINNVTKELELMSPFEFVKYQLELNTVLAQASYLTAPGKTLDDYKNESAIDWQDKLFQTGPVQIHNLSVNGGNKDTKYAISGSVFDQKGVVINSGYNRYQGRVFVDQQINKKINAQLNVNIGNETNFGLSPASSRVSSSQPYSTQLMYQIWGARPIAIGIDLEDELIDPEANDARFNPFISAQNEVRKRITNTLLVNGKVDYRISDRFTLTLRGGINSSDVRAEEFYNERTSRGYPFPDNTLGVNGSIFNTKQSSWVSENLLTYNKKINNNNKFNIVTGFTLQNVANQRNGFASKNIPNSDLGLYGIDEGELSNLSSLFTDFSLMSYLTRFNYNYKSTLLFTASFRADGSSKFESNNRWGYFPSVAIAYNMIDLSFMKKVNFISNSKFRVSYGLTGNNRVGDFSYLSTISFPFNSYYSFNNQLPQQGATLSNFGNSDLKWETTSQFDLGYELSLFKNRINIVADIYRKTTSDLLLNANVPFATGFGRIFKNVGKVQNQGLELTLNTVNIKSKVFEWSSDFNISFNNNKILSLSDNQESIISTVGFPAPFSLSELYLAKIDGPAAAFYGYKWLGNYQISDFDVLPNGSYLLKSEIPSNGNARSTIRPGDIKYEDVNKDGIVNERDRIIIGRGLPLHIGGFNNNFIYKNFSLNVFFQWSYGNDIYNANRDMFEGNPFTRANLNQYASYANRWTAENENNEFYRFGGQGPAGRFSSRVLEDGSFVRLKTISLAYELPEKYTRKLKMRSINLFSSAQNLHTWTNYSGMDPEVSVANSILTPGFDYSAYPRERTLVFGVRGKF